MNVALSLQVLLTIVGLTSFASIAYAQQQTTPEAPVQEQVEPSPLDLPPDTVLATVNGQDIRLEQLNAVLKLLPDEYKVVDNQVLLNTMLRQFVDEALLVEAAREEGMLTQPEVQMLLDAIRRDSISEIYLDRKVNEIVNDAYLQERYDRAKAGYTPVDEVKASHIIVEDEAKIRELAKQLADGTAFADLAKEHSLDGTAQRGGDLGWFVASDMVDEFSDVVFDMEVGEVSEPVQTPFGWHLIKLEDRRARAFPDLATLRPQLESEARNKELRGVIERLRESAEITIKPGFDEIPDNPNQPVLAPNTQGTSDE